ncbi:hypothetical protein Tco_0638533 [Tanacetum coccineum]
MTIVASTDGATGISVALDGDHDKISKVVAFLENFAPKSKVKFEMWWYSTFFKEVRFADKEEEVESECVVDVNSGAELSSPSNDRDILKPCSSSQSDVSLTEPYNKLPKQSNLDATDILHVLHLKYNELIDTSDHGKDLEKYLEYCKDVVFAEVELPFEGHEEDKLIEIFWDFFSKERREAIELAREEHRSLLKRRASYEACELSHDDEIMQSVSNDDEMIQNDDDLSNIVSIDDFVDLS